MLPGFRLVLALEYWQTVSLSSFGSPTGTPSQTPPDTTLLGPSCVQPSTETLLQAFWGILESTRSAIIASLNALYTDFQTEIDDLEVTINGSDGFIRGRYVVGATERVTGRRFTHTGKGIAHFRHNGCSWQLVSYQY